MVEELLHLLIMCATEHANASGATPEQKIRRSIVQYLAINNMAYSELLKLIPESLNEHESFEIQLNEMATFRPPDGLDDKGLYELKPEYLDQLNPYFWHYSRNQREEACEILKLRANRLDPSLKLTQKDEYLHVPKPSPIKGSPFKELGSFLHSHVLCQMVLYSIWNYKMSTQVKSDTILDEAVYLCLLAVTDPNSTANEVMNAGNKQYQDLMVEPVTTFVEHAVNDNYSIQINELERGKATLLTVLIRCIDDPQMAHVHKRLKFIVEKIHYYGSDAVKKRIDDWRHDRIQSAASTADNSDAELSEYERKKAAAKARQASIMSQFANAQAKFMEAHQGLYTEEEDGNDKGEEMDYQNASGISEDNMQVGDDVEVVRKCHFPVDSCIVCQEELEDTKLYGMLGFIQKSNIQRTVPMDNNDIFAEILKASGQENPWRVQDNQEKQEPFCGYPTEAHNAGMDVSTCGHLMHAECFRTYQESVDNQLVAELRRAANISPTIKNRFLCPLCKALGNILLPIVWKGKKEVYPGVTVPTTEYQDIIKVAKDASADLKSKFDGGGSDGQGTPFVNTDPNMTIKDPEKLKHFYNQLITIIFKTTGTAHADIMFNDGDFSMGKAIYDMYRLYAYTISDFEIAQRGIEGTRARDLTVEHTGTFIDDVPSTSQTLLKILGMTYDLIPKVMVSNWDAIQFLVKESLALEALDQLIPFESSNLSYSLFNLKPLLMDDMFEVLVRIGFSLSDYPAIQIHHILRALYLADITKTVIAVVQKIVDQQDHGLSNDLNELNAKHESFPSTDAITHKFVSHVMRLAGMTADSVDRFFSIVRPGALTSIVRTFTLPFLRKALLFMVVYHGFIPQNPGNDDFEEVGEYERLLETLRLPNPETLFELESTDRDFIADWCKDYKQYSLSNSIIEPEKAVMKPLTLNLPTQFRMVTLPYRLDQLLDESSKRACLKCKTVPEHSAVCLICGRFVCARRFCCTEGNRGECNLHMKT